MVFILKIIYKYKSKGNEDLELCLVKKVTYLEFHTEYDEWYLLPNISVSFNDGIDITFRWLKAYYSSFWSIVTYKDEDEYAEFIRNKNEKK